MKPYFETALVVGICAQVGNDENTRKVNQGTPLEKKKKRSGFAPPEMPPDMQQSSSYAIICWNARE
jgi:hypothetical protein